MEMDNDTLPFTEGYWMEEEEYLDKEKHHQENVVQTRAQLNKFKGKNPNPPQMDKVNGFKNRPMVLLHQELFLLK
jgi:hypothetical protein